MKKEYWVMIVENVIVDVDEKPKDGLAALKRYIMGTNLSLDSSAFWFIENGGTCNLGHGFRIVQTDTIGVMRMVDNDIAMIKRMLERIENIKKDMETKE